MLNRIEIIRDNVHHNFDTLRKLVPAQCKVAAVVKANAYGHGLAQIVDCLESRADYWQVDDALEALEISKLSSKPILVFGYIAKDELVDVVRPNIQVAVYDTLRLPELNRLHAVIYIKIDAHLGRQGLLLTDIPEFIRELKKYPQITVAGIYAHYANLEDTEEVSHAQKQIHAFNQAIQMFSDAGYTDIMRHMSATSGVLAFDIAHSYDLVRIGVGLYGMWPSVQLQKTSEARGMILKPVLRWISHVAQVKTIPSGFSIGYGLTFTSEKEMKIAVIPQGYSDGYVRSLSNHGAVLIGGQQCAVLGRVAMNMFVVDVTNNSNVHQEDEVVLLGQQGAETITAEKIAADATINYEITTRISPLLPRILVELNQLNIKH